MVMRASSIGSRAWRAAAPEVGCCVATGPNPAGVVSHGGAGVGVKAALCAPGGRWGAGTCAQMCHGVDVNSVDYNKICRG